MSITRVYERIYISDGPTAMNPGVVERFGITGIIRTASEFDTHVHASQDVSVVDGIIYDEKPSREVNTDEQINTAVNGLARMYDEGRTVLSHCAAGHNRSGAIVVGFLTQAGIYRNVYESYGVIASLRALHIQPLLLQHLHRLYPGDKI